MNTQRFHVQCRRDTGDMTCNAIEAIGGAVMRVNQKGTAKYRYRHTARAGRGARPTVRATQNEALRDVPDELREE